MLVRASLAVMVAACIDTSRLGISVDVLAEPAAVWQAIQSQSGGDDELVESADPRVTDPRYEQGNYAPPIHARGIATVAPGVAAQVTVYRASPTFVTVWSSAPASVDAVYAAVRKALDDAAIPIGTDNRLAR